jgi:hypothetical protein
MTNLIKYLLFICQLNHLKARSSADTKGLAAARAQSCLKQSATEMPIV